MISLHRLGHSRSLPPESGPDRHRRGQPRHGHHADDRHQDRRRGVARRVVADRTIRGRLASEHASPERAPAAGRDARRAASTPAVAREPPRRPDRDSHRAVAEPHPAARPLKEFRPPADRRDMKPATGIGIACRQVGILMSAMMDGTSPASFIDIPAILHHHPRHRRRDAGQRRHGGDEANPGALQARDQGRAPGVQERVELLVSLAEQARREGLLALDAKVGEIDDEFTRKGLQLVVDGIDPELVRDVLEAEIDGMVARHHAGALPFEKAGGFAPTMGIIGTVMGLVHVLQNLSAPSTLGPVDLLRLHRHADGRRLGQRHLPAGRQPPRRRSPPKRSSCAR